MSKMSAILLVLCNLLCWNELLISPKNTEYFESVDGYRKIDYLFAFVNCLRSRENMFPFVLEKLFNSTSSKPK